MTTILQISDTHLSAGNALVSGKLDTEASFTRLVARGRSEATRLGQIDAIIVSGDVSDDGSADSYSRFRELAATLDAPLFVIPGNHDAREAMRSAFAADGYMPQSGKLNWAQRIGDVTLIGLDTLIEGQGGGEIDADTLAFLSDALDDTGNTPVLLALHHPPFRTGIVFMDQIGLKGIEGFATRLAAHPGPARVICGHIHSLMVAEVGGKIAVSGPSPASHFALDLRDNAPVGFTAIPGGFIAHIWRDGFTSTQIGATDGDGPFPF